MKQKLIFLLIYIFCGVSYSNIDIRNGSYNHTDLDFIITNSEVDIRLQREYSSRENRRGWFGWGWCSNFESKLIIDGDEIVFESCRFEITFKKVESNLWTTSSPTKGSIKILNNKYNLDLQDGFIYIFNKQGNLLSLLDRHKRALTLNWTTPLFSKVKTLSVRSFDHFEIQFHFNDMNLVENLTLLAPKGLVLFREERLIRPKNWKYFYHYQDGNLVKVREENNILVGYKYSKLRNLVQINNSNKKYEIQYDEEKDLVRLVISPDGCLEHLDYWLSPKEPDIHQIVKYKKICNKKVLAIGAYEFRYEFHHSAGRYLSSLIVNKNGQTKTVNFNPLNGRPIERKVSNHE